MKELQELSIWSYNDYCQSIVKFSLSQNLPLSFMRRRHLLNATLLFLIALGTDSKTSKLCEVFLCQIIQIPILVATCIQNCKYLKQEGLEQSGFANNPMRFFPQKPMWANLCMIQFTNDRTTHPLCTWKSFDRLCKTHASKHMLHWS